MLKYLKSIEEKWGYVLVFIIAVSGVPSFEMDIASANFKNEQCLSRRAVLYIKDCIVSKFLCSEFPKLGTPFEMRCNLFKGGDHRQLKEAKMCFNEFDESTMLDGLAGFCRSHIALTAKAHVEEYINKVEDSFLEEFFDENLKKIFAVPANTIASILQISEKESIVLKAVLLASTELQWSDCIKLLKRRSNNNGVFQNYSMEESLFILFLKPIEPLFYQKFGKKYKKDKEFYINCLANATKTWLKQKDIEVDFRNDRGSSMASKVFLKYMDSIEPISKTKIE
ncbi:MAG: hypothetical protein LBD17_03160 [Endomicrobium sp.]|jgi:hypothetical protein|nr:hypothetical protein [Endomicrobium sp.]